VRGEHLYARVTDRAVTVGTGSVVTVQGTFEHIDDYEVDEFPNSGHAWLIEQVRDLADRGFVDLGPPYLSALSCRCQGRWCR
jgi:hypothetical protein